MEDKYKNTTNKVIHLQTNFTLPALRLDIIPLLATKESAIVVFPDRKKQKRRKKGIKN